MIKYFILLYVVGIPFFYLLIKIVDKATAGDPKEDRRFYITMTLAWPIFWPLFIIANIFYGLYLLCKRKFGDILKKIDNITDEYSSEIYYYLKRKFNKEDKNEDQHRKGRSISSE